jgi:hypothetical protein
MARCDALFDGQGQENPRFECTQACTTRGLSAIGECRNAASTQVVQTAQTTLARR